MEGFFLASLLFMAATVVNLTMWHFYSFWYNSRLSVLLISTLCTPLTRLDVNVAMLFWREETGKNYTHKHTQFVFTAFTMYRVYENKN